MNPRSRLVFVLPALVFAAFVRAQVPAPENTDRLSQRFANGVVAIAEHRTITVADVKREIAPLVAGIQRDSRNKQEFEQKLEQLENSVIQNLIDRVLIITEFRKDGSKQIPAEYVDNRIADVLTEQFANDRAKFLAYLSTRGQTVAEYRKEVEEDIIYHYMEGQHRKSQDAVSPARVEAYYQENKDKFYQEDGVHLRLIQLARGENDTDATLLAQGSAIIEKMKNGQKFEDLAREYSKDSRRAKGGDWGWMKRTDLKQEFSDPVFALKKGEAAAPVVLPEGCFILFAEDRRYAGTKSLDEAREQIERTLQQQLTTADRKQWLERLRRDGFVQRF